MSLRRLLPLLILAVASLAGCSGKKEQEPLLLGHVAPLSRSERDLGEHARRGILLAVEETNEEGNRIAGRRIAVLHADSRGKADLAVSEMVRLTTINKVLALLGGEPAPANQLASALQSYSVPLVTPNALRNPAPRDGILSLDVAPAFRGEVLARFAGKVFDVKRAVVIVDDDRPLCTAIATAFARKWRAGTAHQVRTLSYDSKGLAMLVGSVRDARAQLVVFAGSAAEFARARAALDAAKLSPTLVFAGEAEEWARLLAEPKAGKGVYGASLYSVAHLSDDGKRFRKRYRASNHEEPDFDAYAGYEMVKVVVQALRDTKGIGGTRLRDELSKERDFDGVTGKLTFKKGRARRPLYVLKRGAEKKSREYKPE